MAPAPAIDHLPSLGFKVWRTPGVVLPHPHVHPDIEILVIERGSMDHYQVGGDTRLEPGSLQCLWAGLPHGSVAVSPGSRFVVACLPIEWLIEHPCAAGLVQALLRGRVLTDRSPAHIPMALSWARDMVRGELLVQAVRHEVLACLLRLAAASDLATGTGAGAGRTADATAQRHALRMANHILARWQEPLDVAAVARSEGLSRGHALLVFKQVLGVGMWRFIQQVRITQALGLLVEDRETVAGVAFRVGFNSLSAFNDTFRRIMGRSPREFRQQAGSANRRRQPR